uniref:Uncharacterized protein n=1 Tax=Anguilla anguilla TaxID=7936 RepID=A0A0E9QES0_ANGAN
MVILCLSAASLCQEASHNKSTYHIQCSSSRVSIETKCHQVFCISRTAGGRVL